MVLPPPPDGKGDITNLPQKEDAPELTQSERDFVAYNKALSDYAKKLRKKNYEELRPTQKAHLTLIRALEENNILTIMEAYHIELEYIHTNILASLKNEPIEDENGTISENDIDSFVEKMRQRCAQIEQKEAEVITENAPERMQKLVEELKAGREKKEKEALKNELISAIGDENTSPEDRYENLTKWRNTYLLKEAGENAFRISVKKNMASYIELYTRAFFFLRQYKNTKEHQDLVTLLTESKLSELEMGMRSLAKILSEKVSESKSNTSALERYRNEADALRKKVDAAMSENKTKVMTPEIKEDGVMRLPNTEAHAFVAIVKKEALASTSAVALSSQLQEWKERNMPQLSPTDEKSQKVKTLVTTYIDYFIALCEHDKDAKTFEYRDLTRLRDWIFFLTGKRGDTFARLSAIEDEVIEKATQRIERKTELLSHKNRVTTPEAKTEPEIEAGTYLEEKSADGLVTILNRNDFGEMSNDLVKWKTAHFDTIEQKDERLIASKELLGAYIDFFIAFFASGRVPYYHDLFEKDDLSIDVYADFMKRHLSLQTKEYINKDNTAFLRDFDIARCKKATRAVEESTAFLLRKNKERAEEKARKDSKDTGHTTEAEAPAVAEAEVIIEKNLEEKAVGELEAIMVREDYIQMGADLALWKNTYAPSITHSDPLLIGSQKMLFAYVDFFITLYQSGDISNVERLKVLLRNSGVKLTVFTKDMIRHATIQTEENEEMRKTFLSSAKTNIIEELISFIQGWKQEIITFTERNKKEGVNVEEEEKDPVARTTSDGKKTIDAAKISPPAPSLEKKNAHLTELVTILDGLENKNDIQKEVRDLKVWFEKNISDVNSFSSLLDETLRTDVKSEAGKQKKARIAASRKVIRDMVNLISTISSHEQSYKAHWDARKERKLQEKRKADLAFAKSVLERETTYLFTGKKEVFTPVHTVVTSPLYVHQNLYAADSAWAHDEMYSLENPFKRPQSLRTLDSCFEHGITPKKEELLAWKQKFLTGGELQKERDAHTTYKEEVLRDYGVETAPIPIPFIAHTQILAEMLVDFLALPQGKRSKFVQAGLGQLYGDEKLKEELFSYIRILTGKQHKIHSNIYDDITHSNTFPQILRRQAEMGRMLTIAKNDDITPRDIQKDAADRIDREEAARKKELEAKRHPQEAALGDPLPVGLAQPTPQTAPVNPPLPGPKKHWMRSVRKVLIPLLAGGVLAGGGLAAYKLLKDTQQNETPEIPNLEKEGMSNYMATPKFMEFFREINALGKTNNNAYYDGVEHYLNANTVGVNTIIHYMTTHNITVADILRTQGDVAIYTAKHGANSYDKHQNVSKEIYALLVEVTKMYQANTTLTLPHVIPRAELYALALNQKNIIEYIKAVNEKSKVITLHKK